MMKLSDYVVRFIADQQVKHVFLVVGGGAMHLNDSLARCQRLQYVCNQHEQASAIAAENYAKATNNLGVCMVTTGPGGTNAVTGLVGGWLDSTPMLVISGQVKRPDRMYAADGSHRGVRQMGVQEADIVSIVKSITKYAVTVDDPNSIRYHLEKAVYLARTGRPGPVWIDIPIDVQAAPIDESSLPGFVPDKVAPHSGSDLQRQVAEVIEALNRAQRPLLLIGNGVRLAGGEAAFQELLSLLNIPVEITWLPLDIISEDHPLYVGRPGTVAPRGANFALQNCDFLLSVGTRLDIPVVGYAQEQLARGAHRVMVDIDPAEIAKMRCTIHTPVCADARAFLEEMLRQRAGIIARDRQCWLQRCQDWKRRYPVVTEAHRDPNSRVSIYHLAEVMSDEVSADEYMVSGSSGSGIEVFLLAYKVRAGRRIFHTTALGAMGFGIPASIGVCMAGDRRPTISVDGDGGFHFNIQELATVANLQLPIKFFVLDNDGYASIRASQTNFFGQASIGCDAATGLKLPDVLKLATAYGLATASIDDQRDLRGQVRRVLQMPGPVVCNVKVIEDEIRAPRMSSSQRPDGSFISKPLEDLWPFLDREEFLSNMIVPPLQE